MVSDQKFQKINDENKKIVGQLFFSFLQRAVKNQHNKKSYQSLDNLQLKASDFKGWLIDYKKFKAFKNLSAKANKNVRITDAEIEKVVKINTGRCGRFWRFGRKTTSQQEFEILKSQRQENLNPKQESAILQI